MDVQFERPDKSCPYNSGTLLVAAFDLKLDGGSFAKFRARQPRSIALCRVFNPNALRPAAPSSSTYGASFCAFKSER